MEFGPNLYCKVKTLYVGSTPQNGKCLDRRKKKLCPLIVDDNRSNFNMLEPTNDGMDRTMNKKV